MKKLLICFLLLPGVVFAAEPALDDFAHGFEITTDGSAAIYRVPLPAGVYSTVTRDDLGDVRVYNGEKQLVPHAIRRQEDTASTDTVWTDVPFFPLPNEIATGSGRLDITVRDDGSIVAIKLNERAGGEQDDGTKRYILDLSALKSNVDALEFTIISAERNYLKRAMLETSNDLNYWEPLMQNAALSSLQYAGHDLVKNRIDLTGAKPKYLRFTWQDEIKQIKITGVRAALNTFIAHHERTWSTVDRKSTRLNSSHRL